MESQHKALYDRLDQFLATQNFSDGGWAEVKDGEINEIGTIFYQIIRHKYEEDADGDMPINFSIVDRTQYRFIIPPSLNIMPYEYKNIKDAIASLLKATENVIHQLHMAFDLQKLDQAE